MLNGVIRSMLEIHIGFPSSSVASRAPTTILSGFARHLVTKTWKRPRKHFSLHTVLDTLHFSHSRSTLTSESWLISHCFVRRVHGGSTQWHKPVSVRKKSYLSFSGASRRVQDAWIRGLLRVKLTWCLSGCAFSHVRLDFMAGLWIRLWV